MLKKLVLEFPPEVLEEDLQDRDVQMKAREGAVMELLRKGKLSQGRAAELLDISRNDLFNLMTKYDIPVMNMSQDELKKELSKQVLEK
jgi:predicted HTH domain antitoxin